MGKGQVCALNSNRKRLENMSEEDREKFREKQRQTSREWYRKNRGESLKRRRYVYSAAKEVIDKING